MGKLNPAKDAFETSGDVIENVFERLPNGCRGLFAAVFAKAISRHTQFQTQFFTRDGGVRSSCLAQAGLRSIRSGTPSRSSTEAWIVFRLTVTLTMRCAAPITPPHRAIMSCDGARHQISCAIRLRGIWRWDSAWKTMGPES
jgi:hypothetical protein